MFSEPKNAVAMKFDAFKASVNNKSDRPKRSRRTEPAPHSVIGRELKIVGSITSSGSLEQGGYVEGDVACEQVTVGKNGHVDGVIMADDVVIQGSIKGHARGAHVSLRSNAHVDGDIIHTTLAIEEGAFFVCSSRSSDNPFGTPGESEKDRPAKPKSKSANGKSVNGHKSNGANKVLNKATLALSSEDVIEVKSDKSNRSSSKATSEKTVA